MHQDDREHRTDDETTARPAEGEQQTPRAAVARMLANPRRTRRA